MEKLLRARKREEQEEELWKDFGCWDLTSHCLGADWNLVEIAPKAYPAYVWYCCCFRERLASYTRAKIAPSDPRRDKVKQLVEEIAGSLKGEREALEWLRPDICRAFKKFVYKYQEGALILLSLIHGRLVKLRGAIL